MKAVSKQRQYQTPKYTNRYTLETESVPNCHIAIYRNLDPGRTGLPTCNAQDFMLQQHQLMYALTRDGWITFVYAKYEQ